MKSSFALVLAAATAFGKTEAIVVPRGGRTYEVTSRASCPFAVDVAQLIDVSWSQLDNSAALKSDCEDVLNAVANSNGRYRVALASFIDKPVAPLGWSTPEWKDYCFKLNIPFGASPEEYTALINEIYLAGGYDFPEAHLDALLRGALAQDFEWRTQTADGLPVQKVLLVATDSIPHSAGDLALAVETNGDGGSPPSANTLTTGLLAQEGLNAECGNFDYPTLSFLSQVLQAKKILPIFLVSPATFACDSNASGRCVFPEMLKLAQETGNSDYADPVKGIQLYYTTLLQKLGVTGVVVPMGEGFKGYGAAIRQAIAEVGVVTCPSTTTSTAAPSTTYTDAPATTADPFSTVMESSSTTAPLTSTTVGDTSSPQTVASTPATVGSVVSVYTGTGEETTTDPTAIETTWTTVPQTVATTPATVGSVVSVYTGTGEETTTDPECIDADCTVRVDMVIEKCDGQKIQHTLIV